MSATSNSGGSASASGARYENLVVAWYASRSIAKVTGSTLLGLPSDVTVTSVRCQTEAPVDDILAETSAGGFVFIQCKRKLSLSSTTDAAFSAAINQFVLQWIVSNQRAEDRPWARPLEPARDRLVLATSAESSASLRVQLPKLLQRIKDTPNLTLEQAGESGAERQTAQQASLAIEAAFRDRLGRSPAPDELSAFVRLLWVQVLDVEDDRSDARGAQETLANFVVDDPAQATIAWSVLTQMASRFAVQRTGGSTATFRSELASAGISLKSNRLYASDIDALRNWTKSKLSQVSAYTRLVANDPVSTIPRKVSGALRAAVDQSYLVTGDPGAGKSGVIYELAEALLREGHDVVFLPVDRLPVSGGAQLTDELRIRHALSDVLENWEGRGNAYLIIDALDAARNFGTQVVFRELITSVLGLGGRWRVVASVRKYDLRFGVEWRNLFSGTPPSAEFSDPEFGRVRHVAIPILSEAEIATAASNHQSLAMFLRHANRTLLDLLKTVFNLHLLAQLLEDGAAASSLSAIRTQLELLDRWWEYRVHRSDHKHDVRERILSDLLEVMLAARSLQVSRRDLRQNHAIDLEGLADLEAHGVLRTTDTVGPASGSDRIQFAHHILFDYGVARIPFGRGADPSLVTERLAKDRDLALVLRPSLNLVCQDTWGLGASRDLFWNLSFALSEHPGVPEVAKLAAPMVAAEQARVLEDLRPLISRLPISATEPGEQPARDFLNHLLGALLVMAASGSELAGPNSGPWCDLVAAMSESKSRSVMFGVRTLLWKFCERPQHWTNYQRECIGRAARNLLAFVWSPNNYDGNLVVNAIEAVLKTYDTDPRASRALVEQAISPEHMAAYAYIELSWIARGVKSIAASDPALVAAMYAAAFGFREKSDEKTSMGQSQLLPLSSNRRQDFEMSWHQLSEAFPYFIDKYPREGVRALSKAVDGYLNRERENDGVETHFRFRERDLRLKADHSYTWRQFKHYRDALTLLPLFDSWLDSLASTAQPSESFSRALDIIADESSLAGIWAGAIAASSRHPALFGSPIADLLAIPEVQQSLELTHDVGSAIPKVYPYLSEPQRRSIETSILGLEGDLGNRAKNILLGTLPTDLIATDGARAAKIEAEQAKAIQPNRPPVEFTSSSGIYDSRAYLRDEGVDVESEAAKTLLSLEDAVKEFSSAHLNANPSPEQILGVWPRLEALWKELERQEGRGEARLLEHALSVAAEVASRVARVDLSGEGFARVRIGIREILRRASTGVYPELHANIEEQFNDSISWGSPSARIEAAQGLLSLLFYHADAEIKGDVERLLRDRVAAVRWHIVHRAFLLIKSDPGFVWDVASYIRDVEDNRGVVAGFLGEVLPRLVSVDRNKAITLAEEMLVRFLKDERAGADKCLEYVLSLMWDLYIWDNDQRASKAVFASLNDIPGYADQLHTLIGRQRGTLISGALDNEEEAAHGARARAFRLFETVAHQAFETTSRLLAEHKDQPFSGWPEAEKEEARRRFGILDLIARECYFASGAYSGGDYPNRADRAPTPVQIRFYREARPLFELLSSVEAAPVAHHLIETLEFFIPVAPDEVFRLVAKSIRTAEKGGYTLEHMGSGLFVRIVERYLADHRDVFSDSSLRNDLLDALDAFVRAGWPDARAITFKIADIWR